MPCESVTRITLFAKRRPDLSREQFYEYWEKVHAPLTAPWLVKYSIKGYSQVMARRSLVTISLLGFRIEKAKSILTDEQIHCFSTGSDTASDGTDGPPFEYDGIAQFDVVDMKTFGGAFADPYYVEVIKADEKNFLDPSARLIRTMGPLKEVVSDGKAVGDVSKEASVLKNYTIERSTEGKGKA
jgi:hypothetical protein